MTFRCRLRAAIPVLLLLAGPPLAAQTSELPPEVLADEAPYRLIYDHVTAAFTLYEPGGDEVVSWEASGQRALAPVPPDRPLEVMVVNANSLLYDYEITAEPLQGGRQVRACRDVGREALSTGFFVGSRSFGAPADAFPSLAGTLAEVADARAAAEEDAPFGFAGGTSAAALMERARAQVQQYDQVLARAGQVAADLDGVVVEVAALAETRPIGPLVDSVMASLNAAQPGMGNPRLVPAVLVSERTRAQASLNAVLAADGTEFDAAASALKARLSAAVPQEQAVAADIQETLLTLARARAAAVQRMTALPAGVHRQVSIEIVDNDAELPVRRTRTGRAVAFTKPAVALVCEVSFGLTWMEPPPVYRAGSDGTLRDEGGRDDVRTSANLMLHLSPSALPFVGVLGGVGIGTSTAPDLYLGGTLRLFRPLMLNGGLVWQRQDRLPAGLQVGQVMADPSLLDDLDRGYEPTAFFGISFGR